MSPTRQSSLNTSSNLVPMSTRRRKTTNVCAGCRSTRSPSKPLHIDLKADHLQMALTYLRYLNNSLVQRRAGLMAKPTQPDEEAEIEETVACAAEEGDEADAESTDPQSQPETETRGDSNGHAKIMDDYLQEAQDGYYTEDSIDDEDVIQPQLYHQDADFGGTPQQTEDESPTWVRYEPQCWPCYIRNVVELWLAEEWENSSDWVALLSEFDKPVFKTPGVFAAWQSKYPENEDEFEPLLCYQWTPQTAAHCCVSQSYHPDETPPLPLQTTVRS